MPREFVNDPEGDVTDEEVNDSGFGDDILAADADGIDVFLLNVGQHHASAVIDDLRRGIDVMGVGLYTGAASPRALGTPTCSRPQG